MLTSFVNFVPTISKITLICRSQNTDKLKGIWKSNQMPTTYLFIEECALQLMLLMTIYLTLFIWNGCKTSKTKHRVSFLISTSNSIQCSMPFIQPEEEKQENNLFHASSGTWTGCWTALIMGSPLWWVLQTVPDMFDNIQST